MYIFLICSIISSVFLSFLFSIEYKVKAVEREGLSCIKCVESLNPKWRVGSKTKHLATIRLELELCDDNVGCNVKWIWRPGPFLSNTKLLCLLKNLIWQPERATCSHSTVMRCALSVVWDYFFCFFNRSLTRVTWTWKFGVAVKQVLWCFKRERTLTGLRLEINKRPRSKYVEGVTKVELCGFNLNSLQIIYRLKLCFSF